MKKSFLTFAAVALVLSFASCKEASAETTPETEVEVLDTPAEAPVEVIETPVEEVVDSSSADSISEDAATTVVE